MRYIGRDKLIQVVELIYRVQEAYFHEWEMSDETLNGLNKKDVQIVQ